MRIELLTREYPPYVYGGAGVHVTELSAALAPLCDVTVRCFDGERADASETNPAAYGYDYLPEQEAANGALKTLGVNLLQAQDCSRADLVHSHTWYANMAGHWAKLLHGVPHVITAHSLEPLRPWKREQLAGGYEISSWAEATAYRAADAIIAVSHGMKKDILRCYPEVDPARVHVIHNGLDLAKWQIPGPEKALERAAVLARYGIDEAKPTVVFVGRITRQKGLPHLMQALRQVDKEAQVVLCAGAPDTPQIAQEVHELYLQLKAERDSGVIWIQDMLPHQELLYVLSAANVFVTPSIYEPMGIVNLEAAAMELPVVGTATGGIPDCIDDGKTGLLVPIEQLQDGTGTPLQPEKFHADLAERLNTLLRDEQRARAMGRAGRARVEELFTWQAVAKRTHALYTQLLG